MPITSLGIGSGVDLNSLVTQLVAVERQPLRGLQSAASRLQTQVSSYGKLQSLFGALQDASNKLTSTTLWAQSLATSSNDNAVGTVGGGSAAAGNYAVSVQQLAGSQTLASGTTFAASSDLVGAGTITIGLGSWDATQAAFTPKPASPAVAFDVTAGDTLLTLRDKINAAGAGVTASVVTDATGVRLSIRSTASGADNGFRATVADSDGNNTDAAGLSRFAYNPPGGANGMQLKQAAQNALATVNGINVVSATNELSTTIEGMTLRLRQVTTAPVDITVSPDRDAISKAVAAFATAYSDLARNIAEQTKYDPATKVGGPLQGDSAASGLQQRLRSVLSASSGASTQFGHLSDLGLELQRDGTLTVNSTKVNTALGNLTEMKKAFANSDTATPANDGFARRYSQLAGQVVATDGSLTTRTEGLRKQITKNGDEQTRLNDRVDSFQKRLIQQYQAMDANVARLNSLSSYVTAQLNAINRPPN